ncbi:MAG: PEP-CTERM sorting domain-containing protein, partial [Rhodanobacter sp.]
CAHNDPCSIGVVNHTYQVGFLPCADVLGVNTSGFTYCLWMNNVTLNAVSTFTFEFIVPSGGSLSSGLTCDTQGLPLGTVTSIDCPSTMPAAGELFPVSFHINPALANRTDFYLFTDFNNSPGVANVSVSVPEPGELGLFGLGLLAIGVGYGWQKRRQNPRAHDVG